MSNDSMQDIWDIRCMAMALRTLTDDEISGDPEARRVAYAIHGCAITANRFDLRAVKDELARRDFIARGVLKHA